MLFRSQDFDREYFGLPRNGFLFLTMFDVNSTIERKNPMATIRAFRNAFEKNTNVFLVIKVNNSDDISISRIKSMIENLQNVTIIAKTISKVEVNSLIKACDVLISLHRAEGFGLTMAEAMVLKRPTIATNWSANTEFMNSENSCLVNFELIEIEEDHNYYKAGMHWADADFEHASEHMIKLYSD